MATLYSNLSPDDASSITDELSSTGVEYQLEDGGTRIMVPQEDVYQVRLDMAGQGLPSGGSEGYKMLDDQGLTTSQFMQEIDYQRATAGELEKTIAEIDGVESARVQLVMPSQDLFAGDDVKPTASVLLITRQVDSISQGQATTIVNLVSASVEGLNREDVVVTDSFGQTLSRSADGMTTGSMSVERLEMTDAFEDSLGNEIKAMLTPVTGPGNVIVQVSADLDFDDRNYVNERFGEPDTAPISSQDLTAESFTGQDTTAAGVLGDVNAGGANSTNAGTSSRTIQQFAVDKVTEEVMVAPGGTRRLAISVIVPEGTDNLDITKIRTSVQAAIGFDATRGDTVSVQEMAFDKTSADAAEQAIADAKAAERRAELIGWIRNGLILLGVAVVLFMLWRATRRALNGEDRQIIELDAPEPLALEPGPDETVERDLALTTMKEALGQRSATSSMPRLTPEAASRQQRANEVAAVIDRQPEEVAALLRSWLADRRG
jgi:flagellar M-ring protein FliF